VSASQQPSSSPALDPSSISRLALPVLGLVGGLQIADPMIASVALVPASRGLDLSPGVTALAASIATLALAASVLSAGSLADILGRRRVLIVGLLLLVLGDALVAIAPGAAVFLLGRAVAGLGLAASFSAAYAAVQQLVTPKRLGSSLGMFAAVGGITMLVVSPLAGLLTSVDWRLAFLVVPLLAGISCLAVLRVVPVLPKAPRARADVPGQVLLAIGVVGVLYGLSRASASVSDPSCWGSIAVGLAALAAFAVAEQRSDHPVFPIGLFRSRIFQAAVIVGVMWNLAQSASQLQVSNLWQYVYHYHPGEVSIRYLPCLIAGIVAAVLVGRALSATGSVRPAGVGCLVAAAGFAALALVGRHTGYLWFVPGLLLIGAGTQIAAVAQSQMFLTEAPRAFYGAVASSRTTVGAMGYAIGLAGSSVLVNRLTTGGITHRLLAAGVSPDQIGQGLDGVGIYARTGAAPTTASAKQALSNAAPSYLHAFSATMWVFAAVIAIAGVASMLLLTRRHPKSAEDAITPAQVPAIPMA
jgi:MFS family permease